MNLLRVSSCFFHAPNTHYEFPLVFSRGKHNVSVVESPPYCIKWQSGYVASTATPPPPPTTTTKNNNCRHRNRCPRWARTARNFLRQWRNFNYVGVFRLDDFARAPFDVPKERKKTGLTLAPNRCSLGGVLWTYSGLGVVLSWDLTHKNTQTSTQAHACRLTDTDPSSLDTNTRGSPCPRIKHAFAQRHKSDKNIPVNLAKTATAALIPISVLTSKCSV